MTSINRRGFTLVELVAVLGIMSLVAALVSETLHRHQRLYREVSETLDVHRSVRDGISILSEEIRGSSAADTIRLMSDSAVELFTALGSSVACGLTASSDIALAPAAATGLSLTSWLALPDTGDLALVYSAASSTPGLWERYRIRAVTSRVASSACPAGSAFVGSGASSYVLSLFPIPTVISPGQPIRFIRRGRYSLYKSSDAKWYLGYRRCNAVGVSSCGAIQPLSGYYQAYSPDTARTGILIRYFDGANQALTAPASAVRVKRIQIIARAVSRTPVSVDGASKVARDSALSSVALRNRP